MHRATLVLLASSGFASSLPGAGKTSSTRHPPLLFTALGETTEDGKKLEPTSSATPIYFTAPPGKYRPVGDAPPETAIGTESMEGLLRGALVKSGFQPADADHPPTVGLIYFWGPHTVVTSGSSEQILRNTLDRAALVGGDKFATDLAKAFRESATIADVGVTNAAGHGDLIARGSGAAQGMAQIAALADPVLTLKRRAPENEALLDQAEASCYYLVVSAYEYKSLATPQKKLLWRTRATVNSQGVSQAQVFPTLVSIAAPFFGKDSGKPQLVRMRANEALVQLRPEPAETASAK